MDQAGPAHNYCSQRDAVGGRPLDTRTIAESQPNEFVLDISWSPSGDYLTYIKYLDSFPHMFYVNLVDGSPPVELGIATESACRWP